MDERIRVTQRNAEAILELAPSSNRSIARAAFELGYAVYVYKHIPMIQICHKRQCYRFYHMQNPINSYMSSRIANNKFLTHLILSEANVPVPEHIRVLKKDFENGDVDFSDLHYPVVVKPLKDSEGGIGVRTNIQNERTMIKALRTGFKKRKKMLVEEFYTGLKEYRVMVLDGKVIAVTYRIPAYVIGDGKHNIRDLIVAKNIERKAVTDIDLHPIPVDTELKKKLKRQRYTLRSVPKKRKMVSLRNVCNAGVGGEIHDATDDICPENKKLAVKATKAMGLRLAGIDLMCEDIRKPLSKNQGGIIEVNQHPGTSGHHFPQFGKPRDVSTKIVKALFR